MIQSQTLQAPILQKGKIVYEDPGKSIAFLDLIKLNVGASNKGNI